MGKSAKAKASEAGGPELVSGSGGVPIKAWVKGVGLDVKAEKQLRNVARLPFIYKWVAAMPDVHWGLGATIGSVIPTRQAIIPAAVGVDIGCGMMACRTSLEGSDLPAKLGKLRAAVERAVPHGRGRGGKKRDRGAWDDRRLPKRSANAWRELEPGYKAIAGKHRGVKTRSPVAQLGTLGSGNHFVEICLDEESRVWIMLHSGSRGIGNRIGTYFIDLARQDIERQGIGVPDRDLAYFQEGSRHFADYFEAVEWAQGYAATNRRLMMEAVIEALKATPGIRPFKAKLEAINCHHNYVAREQHFGEEVLVTRKGAVRAGAGEMGIIPGSMGARSYIVRGKGNPESFESCSHGAGRLMSRSEAKRRFSLKDHAEATKGVECRKDAGVIDETPGAYKPIEKVMAAQRDLVEIVYTLRQIVCVKG